jgi:hypothetical protein
MSVLHESHHESPIALWESKNAGLVWPFIDAVIVPGMFLKKHDLFAGADVGSERWPVLYPFPVGGFDALEELWPLVTARAFLASFLRKVLGKEAWDAPAWKAADTKTVMGGAPIVADWRPEWRVVALGPSNPKVDRARTISDRQDRPIVIYRSSEARDPHPHEIQRAQGLDG